MEILNVTYAGNTVYAYLHALGLFFVAALLLTILKNVLVKRLKPVVEKTATRADDYALATVEKRIIPLVYIGAFYLAVNQLLLNDFVYKIANGFIVFALIFQLTRLLLEIVFAAMQIYWNRSSRDQAVVISKGMKTIIQIIVWSIALVFILDNLGFDVTAVVAGLGISGIAIALAAQTILGDLFNYFVIFFDKPFRENDFIVVGDYMGTVEHVGIKTTRVRSLSGEQIVISNSDLTGSRLRNYKRMELRRVVFELGVVYQTPLETVKKIPEIIKDIFNEVEKTRFDRAHFKSFGDFSLNFEVVYYVLSSDYNVYMDIQQEVNLRIAERFEAAKIEFAYPTQTVFVEGAAGPAPVN